MSANSDRFACMFCGDLHPNDNGQICKTLILRPLHVDRQAVFRLSENTLQKWSAFQQAQHASKSKVIRSSERYCFVLWARGTVVTGVDNLAICAISPFVYSRVIEATTRHY
jgi:hypothetical protein